MSYKECLWSHTSQNHESCPNCNCHYLEKDGFLKATNCSDLHGYLCVYENEVCPIGTVSYKKACIELVRNTFTESDDPQLNCKWKNDKRSSKLVEIHTEDLVS